MELIITSAWRANNQRTIYSIPKGWRKRTTVLVPRDQYEIYRENVPDSIRIHYHNQKQLSPTRQWIVDHIDRYDRYCILLDDDLDFMKRDGSRLRRSTPNDTSEMFELLESWLEDGIAHVGVSPRAGNNHVETDYAETTRAMRVLGFDFEVIRNVKARFDRIPCMSDFDMTLQLLEAGYKNRVSYLYANGQPGSNTKGGCAKYRTPDLLKHSAETLARLHPGIVTVHQKKTSKPWDGFDSTHRTDVIVHWKKALKKIRPKTGISNFFKCEV